jgi:hypothetical protein
MKKFAIILLSLVFIAASFSPAIAKHRRGYQNHHNRGNHYGYSHRPLDRKRHYNQRRDRRGRDHHYRGHWRSWNDWHRYYRSHPEIHRHGRYFHDGSHLMFQFCDPESGGCFFFSIGR